MRWMLKVGIHGDYTIAAGAPQPGAKRGLVPEISRKADVFDSAVDFRCRFDGVETSIGASVIHDDYFVQPLG